MAYDAEVVHNMLELGGVAEFCSKNQQDILQCIVPVAEDTWSHACQNSSP
ncbi:hypothetical protein Pint_10318 [Pistacia integerrima]|uniref:Uncharacterized protein n=2 Tax=Pistacia TaxID=55512 RepID=A0ACC1A539_9ROSI|nr:hypothetical protein Pint_10318 [Pistacia integerrima]KAJ0081345.1 hypothetical protein Patl1_10420 [Pistacia atlantica]